MLTLAFPWGFAPMFVRIAKIFALVFAVAVITLLTTLQSANAAPDIRFACSSGGARIAFAVILSTITFKVFGVWLNNIEKLQLAIHKLKVLAELSDENEFDNL
jgi:hypothetical protein